MTVALKLASTLVTLCLVILTTNSAVAEVYPFQIDAHGRPLLQVTFNNGDHANFLLDSAARRTGIVNALADKQLAKRQYRSTIRHFSSAGLLALPLAKLNAFSLFDRQITENIIALYPDDAIAKGLIGFDALRGQLLRFEPSAQAIHVTASPADIARQGWLRIDGRYNRHLGIVLSANYHNLEIDVLVATGSSHTILDRAAATRLFPDKNFSLFFGVNEVYQGLAPQPRNLDTIVLKDFSIGGWYLGNLEVTVAVLPSREATGYMDSSFMMLGADVLTRQNISLDFRDHAVWIPANDGR